MFCTHCRAVLERDDDGTLWVETEDGQDQVRCAHRPGMEIDHATRRLVHLRHEAWEPGYVGPESDIIPGPVCAFAFYDDTQFCGHESCLAIHHTSTTELLDYLTGLEA